MAVVGAAAAAVLGCHRSADGGAPRPSALRAVLRNDIHCSLCETWAALRRPTLCVCVRLPVDWRNANGQASTVATEGVDARRLRFCTSASLTRSWRRHGGVIWWQASTLAQMRRAARSSGRMTAPSHLRVAVRLVHWIGSKPLHSPSALAPIGRGGGQSALHRCWRLLVPVIFERVASNCANMPGRSHCPALTSQIGRWRADRYAVCAAPS